MAVKTAAELAIDVTMNAAKATSGMDQVGDAAVGMGRDVDAAGSAAQETARKLALTADSADEMAGKTGKATGALGALSSGFELVGAEKYAGALQGAAMATDFMSGAGDALNLVMESTIIKNVKGAITTAAQTTATVAQTAAQWALNAALNANPVALIVIAILALVAGLVLAYKKSETFRNIVNGAFKAVKNAAESAFNWVKNNWPLLLAIITGPIGLAVLAVVKNWDKIKAGATLVKQWIIEKFVEAKDRLVLVATNIKNAMLAPFQAISDAIQTILDLIGKIKIPNLKGSGLPFVPGLRVAGTTTGGTDPLLYQVLTQLLQVLRQMIAAGTPRSFVDELALAQVIQGLLDRSARVNGVTA